MTQNLKKIRLDGTDFILLYGLATAPILKTEVAEQVADAILFLQAKRDKFHKKLVKRYKPTLIPSPDGNNVYDWGENLLSYQQDVEKGLKINLSEEEVALVKHLSDYLEYEFELNRQRKIHPPYSSSGIQRVKHFIKSIS